MKKNIKHLLTCLSLLIGISVVSTSVKAAPNTMSLKDLDAKYGLKTISAKDVPSNVKPMEFKSVADADAYLSKHIQEINNQNKIIQSKVNNLNVNKNTNTNTTLNSNRVLSLLSASLNSSQTKEVNNVDGITWYNMTVTYGYSGSTFDSCNSINTYIAGWTAGYTYTQQSSYSNIIDGGRTLAASANGVETDYLLINGGIQIGNVPRSLYGEFYLN